MANVDRPSGLKCVGRSVAGGMPDLVSYKKDAAGAAAIFVGDVVNREADSFIAPGGTPGTTNYLGVALNWGAALMLTEHMVVNDPFALFSAQGDDGTALDEADSGLNCNFVFGAGGSSAPTISGHELDASSKATTATLDAKLHTKLASPDNEYGEFCEFIVTINRHALMPGIAGV